MYRSIATYIIWLFCTCILYVAFVSWFTVPSLNSAAWMPPQSTLRRVLFPCMCCECSCWLPPFLSLSYFHQPLLTLTSFAVRVIYMQNRIYLQMHTTPEWRSRGAIIHIIAMYWKTSKKGRKLHPIVRRRQIQECTAQAYKVRIAS